MVVLLAACAHRPPAPAPPPPPPPAPSAEARAFYLRAAVATELGDAAEAERASAWLPRLDGADPWAHARVAELALRGGRPEAARDAAASALVADPELPEAHRVAGLAALALGDPAGAAAHLERARGLPGVGAALVRARRDAGGDALAALRDWTPATPSERLERSALALELGRADEALADALAVADHPVLAADAVRAALATCRLDGLDERLGARWAAELAAARAGCAGRG